MDKFKTVLGIAEKQTNLGFGFVALLTAGGEQIFSTVVFKCPCNQWNFVYGMVFLVVPALALLVMGYILSKKTWKLLTGLCYRRSKLCRPRTVIAFGLTLFQITTTAMVAPSSWIAVALLTGNYFQCAMTGVNVTFYKEHLCEKKCLVQEELYKLPCDSGKSTSYEIMNTLRAESQILGWLLIASMVLSNLLLTCLARCRSPISYLQLKFWTAYSEEESKLLESYSSNHARELAERNMKSFFMQTPPKDMVTPSNDAWRKVSALYSFSTDDHYYSTMHKYVETFTDPDAGNMRMASIRSDGLDVNNPSVLQFVDESKGML